MKSWKHISTAQVDAIDDWTVPTFVSVDVDSGGSEVGGGTTPASLLLAAPGQSSSTTTLPKSTMIAVDDVGGETRGNRRQRHLRRLRDHKERLRWLTDRFANASKASLVVGQRSSMESTARSTTMASVTRAKGDADAANAADANDEGVVDGVGREDQGRVEWGFLDYVKKMTSSCMCSLAMLLDDDDVTLHEGRIIGIPNRGEKYGMYRRSSSSDISSLTGDTPRIYQKRYYAEDVSDGMRWYKT